MPKLTLLALTVAALIAAGCGDNDDAGATSSATKSDTAMKSDAAM